MKSAVQFLWVQCWGYFGAVVTERGEEKVQPLTIYYRFNRKGRWVSEEINQTHLRGGGREKH